MLPRRPRPAECAWAAVASLLLSTSPAWASGGPLSLGEALRLAVAQSPELAAQHALAEGASVGVVAAGALPDPKLKATLDNLPTTQDVAWTVKDPATMLKIGLSQEIPGGNKLELRTRRARLDAQRESVMVEAQRAAVQRDVAMAWVARRYAAEADAAVVEEIGEAQLAVEAGSAQYRAGKASQTDLIVLQGAVVELKNRRTEIGVQVRRAQIALARFIGADAERPLGDAPDLGRMPPAVTDGIGTDEFPAVKVARAQEMVAATDADLAQAEYWPDWKVELSYGWRGRSPIVDLPFQAPSGGLRYSQVVSLEVTIDLPLFTSTRQGPRHAAKLKELDAARALREEAKRRQAAEVQGMVAEWESARAQARRIKDELIPLAIQRREAATAAYSGGIGSLGAALEARRAELDARLSLVQMEQAAAKAWAWLAFVYPVTEPL